LRHQKEESCRIHVVAMMIIVELPVAGKSTRGVSNPAGAARTYCWRLLAGQSGSCGKLIEAFQERSLPWA
jgi:hypothetical protein